MLNVKASPETMEVDPFGISIPGVINVSCRAPGPQIDTSAIGGRFVSKVMLPDTLLKVISSRPGFCAASNNACRREPAPLSCVLMTTKVAAPEGKFKRKIANPKQTERVSENI